MKNYLVSISIVICASYQSKAQSNLVLNANLEKYYDTTDIGHASFRDGYVTDWSDPNGGTSDFFAPYSRGGNSTPPRSIFGFEYPHSGYCYGGFLFFWQSTGPANYELVQASFRSPLQAGKTYVIESFVSLGYNSVCFSDLGFYFSDTMLATSISGGIIPVTAQFENPTANLINTHDGWQRITGTYTALGGENYMSIGIFKPYSMMHLDTCTDLGGSFDAGKYLFIDDVAVYDTSKVDTIHLCANDSVQLGGIWRSTAGLYTDMISGLPVKFYILPRPFSANLTFVDRPFLPGDSVKISMVQKGVDVSFYEINQLWVKNDTTFDIPMFNIYGCDSTVRYRCGSNIGINDLSDYIGLQIYPNPANDFMDIKISNADKLLYSISIVDMTGRTMLTMPSNTERIDVSSLHGGLYFVQLSNVKSGKVAAVLKFVKK